MILKKIKILGENEVYERLRLNYNECNNICRGCFYADTLNGLLCNLKRKCRAASLTTKPTWWGLYYTYRPL